MADDWRDSNMDIQRRLLRTFAPTAMAARERDQGHWAEAAALYRSFLAKTGRNIFTFGYIVQLGNCLKEAGQYLEALVVYDDAIRINSRNADLHLQRGHLYKLMGDTPAAAWAYHHAFNLDPGNRNARFEIEASGARAVAGMRLSNGKHLLNTIWFDVTDFVEYARHNLSLSGIQRVCGNLMLNAADLRLMGYRVAPVLPDYDSGQIYAAGFDNFIELVELFSACEVDHNQIINAADVFVETKSPVTPGDGDILVIVGAFWIVPRYDMVAQLRRRGMKIGVFIHDLIPLRNPEYAIPVAVEQFQIRLFDAARVCDFFLANSKYVQEDVRSYLRQAEQRDVPVMEILLPTELVPGQTKSAPAKIDDPLIGSILARDYVLVVSTIEVRKNHALMIRVWEQLREELGEATPNLVFVGKWGWEVSALRAYIDDRGYEGDWLFVLNAISDPVMESLYKHALFTVYPSFAEGFGLPIGESLAHGTPCIASGTTAMPEVGGDFVRYFDPFDWTSALPVIRRAIVDHGDLRRWREHIADEFKPRKWSEFCDNFYRTVIACAEAGELSSSTDDRLSRGASRD